MADTSRQYCSQRFLETVIQHLRKGILGQEFLGF
jgi:hypothetical protein